MSLLTDINLLKKGLSDMNIADSNRAWISVPAWVDNMKASAAIIYRKNHQPTHHSDHEYTDGDNPLYKRSLIIIGRVMVLIKELEYYWNTTKYSPVSNYPWVSSYNLTDQSIRSKCDIPSQPLCGASL